MACNLFLGFDVCNSGVVNAPVIWQQYTFPSGIYHNSGVPTLNQNIGPVRNNFSQPGYDCFYAGRVGNSHGYGTFPGVETSPWGAATAITRAMAHTGKFYQLAMDKNIYGINDSVYMMYDFNFAMPIASFSGQPPSGYQALFKWGDVDIKYKQQTASATSTMIFAVNNNGVEVSTVTVPSVTVANWHALKLFVRLNSGSGQIDFSINGINQSGVYTGQNTVAVTPLGSAQYIYFGPPISDNGTTAYAGIIDNVYFSADSWPSGRPRAERLLMLNDISSTGWFAEGTSPTTIANAISNSSTDVRAARGYTGGAVCLMAVSGNGVTLTNLNTGIIGYNLFANGVSNRDAVNLRKLQVGISLSGTQHTMGNNGLGVTLPFDSVGTPPALFRTNFVENIYNVNYHTGLLTGIWMRMLVV